VRGAENSCAAAMIPMKSRQIVFLGTLTRIPESFKSLGIVRRKLCGAKMRGRRTGFHEVRRGALRIYLGFLYAIHARNLSLWCAVARLLRDEGLDADAGQGPASEEAGYRSLAAEFRMPPTRKPFQSS
jgi:hypothetical protein